MGRRGSPSKTERVGGIRHGTDFTEEDGRCPIGSFLFASAGAQAQGLVTNQKLSAALANELVGDSVAECAKKGYTVTAVVVDLDGVRQAVLRGNGAPIQRSTTPFTRPTRQPR